MACWLAATLLMALASLTLARFLEGPRWVDALLAAIACAAVSLALLAALGIRRLAPRSWALWSAALLALAAASGRASLLTELQRDPLAGRTLEVTSLALAVSSVVWGALALLWGSSALSDSFSAGQEQAGFFPWLQTGLAGSVLTLSLYSLAPVWHLLGLEVNLLTLGGLFLLAAAAYAISSGYRWLRRL